MNHMPTPVTFITGTRKGLGRALVEHYVRVGHAVVGCSRESIDWQLDGYVHYVADVADEQAVRAAFGDVWRRYGRLDHLINNAGIAAMNHSLLTPLSTLNRILSTNVAGTFLVTREAAKLMKSANYGRIVNLTSVVVPLKLEGESAYAATKAAVNSLTEVLARELAAFGITVNAVGPTPVDTLAGLFRQRDTCGTRSHRHRLDDSLTDVQRRTGNPMAGLALREEIHHNATQMVLVKLQ
jgi:3-oxoacyl-[acyl-carrier protein] reductase